MVEPSDAFLDDLLAAVELDMLQVHAHAGAERFAEIRARTGLPVLAVVSVAEVDDLREVPALRRVADGLLFDAKPPKDAELPGGNALSFDHRVLAAAKLGNTPWMLAGGLTPENVAEAIAVTQPTYVDVSSGVERGGSARHQGRRSELFSPLLGRDGRSVEGLRWPSVAAVLCRAADGGTRRGQDLLSSATS